MNKEASIKSALRAMQNNRPLRAEETCRDYLLMNPGCADHLRLLGHSLMKQNRLTEAEEQLRLGLSLQPDFPQLLEDLGSALAMRQKYDEAIPLFEKAIRLEPRLPLAHKKLGQALAAVGRGAEADEQFEEFFDKDPEAGVIALGANHLKSGRKDEAKQSFRDVLRNDLEGQVRRILEHCGLPFEESCVNFHQTKRAVKTASSEQVRQPIYTGALGKWRKYEAHLDLWKEEFADIIEQLPVSVRSAAE